MFSLSKKYSPVLRLIVIILLIFAMVFVSSVGNYAQALALSSSLIAVVATILIASGIIAESDTDLEAVSTEFYNFLTGDALLDVIAISQAYGSVINGSFKFKVTPHILSSLGDWLASRDWTFSDAGVGDFIVPGSSEAIFQGMDFSSIFKPNYNFDDFYAAYNRYDSWLAASNAVLLSPSAISPDLLDKQFYYKANGSGYGYKVIQIIDGDYCLLGYSTNGVLMETEIIESLGIISSEGLYNPKYPYMFYVNGNYFWLPLDYNGATGSVTTFPQSNVKSDTTFFPGEAVSSGVGTTEFPSNTASQPLTTDIPLTIPETGVDVNTGVGDVRGEAEAVEGEQTGTITSDGSGTGIFEGIGTWVLNIPILGDLLKVLGQILEAILSFFDVSQFELDFSPLKCGLTTVFPFCIPFDFLRAVEVFAADSSSFSFDIDLDTKYFKIDHTVDLSPFALPIAFFRYVVVFWFGYILISRTRDLIKW